MRKTEQKQILDLIGTLFDANAEMVRLSAAQDVAAVTRLLVDCQEFVLNICDFIEDLEGSGTHAAALLEAFYQSLYRASSDRSLIKGLSKDLLRIEQSVKEGFKPDRIEIVFLPYKASMWDCFESVWLAAKDDLQCDVYVAPIPYYDKLPDGRFGEMHYEGDQYPDYVPITDYRSYDLEVRRPDVVFIHNPFDDSNYVTSVPPDYYSSKLKNLTDLLCYIPYYAVVDVILDVSSICEGVKNSHKIFWQSERVRQNCIDHINEYEEAGRCKGFFGNILKKAAAVGSPKFDKVINANADSFVLPEIWRRIIETPKGARKKTILYNTSISSMLHDSEQYIQKLRYVLAAFKSRDDVALWWRPHPLGEAAYRSMRPQLVQAYTQIVDAYRREGWGIYDDTPDVHRAVYYSSMLYGDWGSLVAFYLCHNKPVLIQDCRIHGQQHQSHLIPVSCLYETEQDFWFTALYFNALFRMDKQTWKAEYINSFPIERTFAGRQYRDIAAAGQDIYFLPGDANEMAVYNRESGAVSKIDLPMSQSFPREQENHARLFNNFTKIFPEGDWLFLLPFLYPGVVLYNWQNRTFKKINDWVNRVDKLSFDAERAYFLYGKKDEHRNSIMLACANANAMVEINAETHKSFVHKLGENKIGYVHFAAFNDTYWLLAWNKPVIARWCAGTNAYEEYNIKLDGIAGTEEWLFQKLKIMGDNLCLVPYQSRRMVMFNIATKRFSYAEGFVTQNPEDGGNAYPYLYNNLDTDKNIYVQVNNPYFLVEYDPAAGFLREEGVQIEDPDNRKKLHEYLLTAAVRDWSLFKKAQECIMNESVLGYSLEDVLDALTQADRPEWLEAQVRKQSELFRREIANGDGTAGRHIYETAKRETLA